MSFSNSIVLKHRDLELSTLRFRDRTRYIDIRKKNREWLQPWDATLPKVQSSPQAIESRDLDPTSNSAFFSLLIAAKRSNSSGSGLILGMRTRGRLIGLITAANLTYGAARNFQVGYWIDSRYAGKGITPRAVALIIDYLILERHFHRAEIAIRPENKASLRVVEKLQLRPEGLRPRYLHIDGGWRDHLIFAVDSSEIENGLVSRIS